MSVWFGLTSLNSDIFVFLYLIVPRRNLTAVVLHFANFFLSMWETISKQFNFTVNNKSSGKMESVTLDVVAKENQEECLGIQDQASREVQVSKEEEVSHCHLLAKPRASYRRQNEPDCRVWLWRT